MSKQTKTTGHYRRLFKYLKPHRKQFAIALGAMVIFGASDGAIPFLLKHVLDDIFGKQDKNMLWLLVGAIGVFAVVRAVFGFLQRYFSECVGLKIIQDLRDEISEHLLHLSPSFYARHATGSLLARMTNDTLLVRRALSDASVTLIRDSIRIVALLGAALVLDPILGAIAFVALPLGVFPIIRFGKKVRRLSRTGQDQLGGLTTILHENIVGHRVVQAFSMEPYENKRFRDENNRSTKSFIKAGKYGALTGPSNELIGSVAVALVIVYGGLSVISGVRTQGDFIAFITAMLLLYEPVKKLGNVNAIIQTGIAAADRIFEVIDTQPDISEKENAIVLDSTKPQITFKNVSFHYPQEAYGQFGKEDSDQNNNGKVIEWALKDISLMVKPGETVALVGSSGAGKSTMVSLLPRFYDPQLGSIEIDGEDIRDVTLSSLRQHVSVVGQHTFLFFENFLHNISYGRKDASEEEIVNAAKAANIHEFIQSLPEGYQTIIGEQGMRLSGGQRARVAIARALLKDAPVLILDEATASLDSESEKLVHEAIDRLLEGRTVLVIAHRLSTIRNADRIAVMSQGKIVELGTHDELLRKNGVYAKLHRLQFKDDEQQHDTLTVNE